MARGWEAEIIQVGGGKWQVSCPTCYAVRRRKFPSKAHGMSTVRRHNESRVHREMVLARREFEMGEASLAGGGE